MKASMNLSRYSSPIGALAASAIIVGPKAEQQATGCAIESSPFFRSKKESEKDS
jgi:hypothetical protein